jgi:hypothetical protein
VRVETGLDSLPPPTGAEAITLRSIEAPENVRLACQIRPTADLTVAIISRPATPGPPQESFDDIKEFVAAHVRGVLGDHLVEVRSSDTAALARWLARSRFFRMRWAMPRLWLFGGSAMAITCWPGRTNGRPMSRSPICPQAISTGWRKRCVLPSPC